MVLNANLLESANSPNWKIHFCFLDPVVVEVLLLIDPLAIVRGGAVDIQLLIHLLRQKKIKLEYEKYDARMEILTWFLPNSREKKSQVTI